MLDDKIFSKIEILIQQKKYTNAEKIILDLLTEDSNNIQCLSFLAEVYLQQDKYEKAGKIIDTAICLSPDSSELFYTKSRIAIQQENIKEAEKNINQAIELDSYDADYFALLANIKLARKDFEKALDIANQALEIDAENLLAINTRSTALNKLNRSEESFETINRALHDDPNNAFTHANFAWALLENRNHKKALEHFKESLSIDPTFEYAQTGMLEALKATNPVYRMFLRYSFWMTNLTSKYQWGVIIAFLIITRVLNTLARNYETLQPYIIPIYVVFVLVSFSTWVINPISNLFLRFNKYGQFLLDKTEKMNSNFVAVSFLVFIFGITLYFVFSDEKMMTIAIYGFVMMLPFGNMFSSEKNKYLILISAITLAIVGLFAIGLTFSTGQIFNFMTIIFLFGFIGFQLIANFLIIKKIIKK
jgi:tetratricopeptide (TPR) repeat protein